MTPLTLPVLVLLVELHIIHCDASASDCAVIQQANVVSGTGGLSSGGSTATVKFLGKLTTPAQCEAACESNSTASDPCRSWAFYFPETGVYTRQFTHATVSFDTATNTGSFQWKTA